MFKTHTYHLAIALALAASAALPAAAKTKNVLDLKTSITDSHIIYPESYEADTQKLLEGWYLKITLPPTTAMPARAMWPPTTPPSRRVSQSSPR